MRNLFWLTEAQMARLRPILPKSHGRQRVDDLRVLSGATFINRRLAMVQRAEGVWAAERRMALGGSGICR